MKKVLLLETIFLIIFFLNIDNSVNAQVIDSSLWQTGATGLKTQTQADKRTAGLGFIVEQQSWPLLIQRGGITIARGLMVDGLSGPIGIPLGQISIPGSTSSFTSETVDWAHNEMVYTYSGSNQLKVVTSRLTPAILLQAPATTVNFLTSLNPKYIAYSSGGSIQVKSLSTTPLNLSLDKNWILVWYGNNSTNYETKRPLICSNLSWDLQCHVPISEQYLADIPILFIFQNNPTSARQISPGLELTFSSSMGYTSLLPLFGRNNLRSLETETWASGLPSSVQTKINFWSTHLCSYPKIVSETYAYDVNTDTASITENFNFQQVCNGGNSFAPLPPMLALSKDAIGVTFSNSIIDANLATEFGPVWGIENTNSYTWKVAGLAKYVDSKRIYGTAGQVPSEINSILESEVTKVIAGNHWAPWIFLDAIPVHFTRGELYWANPADTVYHLTEVVQALPDNSTSKTNLINYLKTERNNYPPENMFDQYLTENNTGGGKVLGTIRKNYSTYQLDWFYTWGMECRGNCDVGRLKKMPLSNFYSLSSYYDLPNIESLPSSVYSKAKTTLNEVMEEQDWASFYWFKGFDIRRMAVWNINDHFSGLVGFIRLAKKSADTVNEHLGRALLAKAVVLKLGTTLYPKYLYPAGITEIPNDPLWFLKYGYAYGFYNINWASSQDDARQAALFDQFYITLHHHSGFVSHNISWNTTVCSPYLISYRGLTPELGRLLADKTPDEALIYQKKVEELFPHWYQAYAEGTLGGEHGLNHPIDSFQTFLAKSWIQKETAQNLELYSDISWLTEGGDLFYMQKLAETVKAYKGWSWSDQPLPTQGPTATPTPSCTLGTQGDVNCDRKIDILDLVSVLSNFGRIGSGISGDVNGDGKVDILDLVTLLSNFGRSQ